ncbi:hypothetical protein ND864_17435 [Leptospira levettii]|uniref:hypothetical protein n=1 Tax=Leptospira levettii TaxID=2023178 RepID=UPI00223DC1F8|nr:hypothetical protein [Leptospira levettii]MCW7467506.1 hypothetical protein [Leptospira levettii]
METNKYLVDSTIEDYLRINLRALHLATGTEVAFPQIHALVEKINEGNGNFVFSANCLEYSQIYESSSAESAVVGLINYMFAYFFETLKKEEPDFLINQAKDPNNDPKWGEIRAFMARKRIADMKFVRRSMTGADKDELHILAKSIPPIHKSKEGVMGIDAHEKIVKQKDDFINAILRQLRDANERLKNSEAENRSLKNGLEAAQEWMEEEPEITKFANSESN